MCVCKVWSVSPMGMCPYGVGLDSSALLSILNSACPPCTSHMSLYHYAVTYAAILHCQCTYAIVILPAPPTTVYICHSDITSPAHYSSVRETYWREYSSSGETRMRAASTCSNIGRHSNTHTHYHIWYL